MLNYSHLKSRKNRNCAFQKAKKIKVLHLYEETPTQFMDAKLTPKRPAWAVNIIKIPQI